MTPQPLFRGSLIFAPDSSGDSLHARLSIVGSDPSVVDAIAVADAIVRSDRVGGQTTAALRVPTATSGLQGLQSITAAMNAVSLMSIFSYTFTPLWCALSICISSQTICPFYSPCI